MFHPAPCHGLSPANPFDFQGALLDAAPCSHTGKVDLRKVFWGFIASSASPRKKSKAVCPQDDKPVGGARISTTPISTSPTFEVWGNRLIRHLILHLVRGNTVHQPGGNYSWSSFSDTHFSMQKICFWGRMRPSAQRSGPQVPNLPVLGADDRAASPHLLPVPFSTSPASTPFLSILWGQWRWLLGVSTESLQPFEWINFGAVPAGDSIACSVLNLRPEQLCFQSTFFPQFGIFNLKFSSLSPPIKLCP